MAIGLTDIVSASVDQAKRWTGRLLGGQDRAVADTALLTIWPYEPIAEALKSPQTSDDVKSAIVGVVAEIGQDLIDRIETQHGLDKQTIITLENWCNLVDLAQMAPLSSLARRLFKTVTAYVDAANDLIPQVARAALVHSDDYQADFDYWLWMLAEGPAAQFAFRRVMKIDPEQRQLEPALERLWHLQVYNGQKVDTALLMSSLVRARGGRVDLVRRVLSRLAPGVLSIVCDELRRRKWTESWVDLAPNLAEPSFPPHRHEFPVYFHDSFDYEGAKRLLNYISADESILEPEKLDRIPSILLRGLDEYFRHFDILGKISYSGKDDITYFPRIKYPLFAETGFMKEHDELINSIEATEDIYFKNSNLKEFRPLDRREFDIDMMDRKIPMRARYILGLAFFFCPSVKQKEFWSAIPLGKQRAIGLICHNTLWTECRVQAVIDRFGEAAQTSPEMDNVDRALMSYLSDIGCSREDILGLGWNAENTAFVINRLLEHLKLCGESRIFVRRGFVMGDILIEYLRDHFREDLIPEVSTMLTPDDSNDDSTMAIFPRWRHFRRLPHPELLKNSIALFDLGYMDKIVDGSRGPFEENGLGEYKVIIIKHGVDIDVGLGFSLPVLPFLFRRLPCPAGGTEYWWQYVSRECGKIYGRDRENGESARNLFLRAGIELDKDYFGLEEVRGAAIAFESKWGKEGTA